MITENHLECSSYNGLGGDAVVQDEALMKRWWRAAALYCTVYTLLSTVTSVSLLSNTDTCRMVNVFAGLAVMVPNAHALCATDRNVGNFRCACPCISVSPACESTFRVYIRPPHFSNLSGFVNEKLWLYVVVVLTVMWRLIFFKANRK